MTVPCTEEVTDSRHELFDCTQTPLVLVSNYSDIGTVDGWVLCVGDMFKKYKLIGDENNQYYQTIGVKTMKLEARCGTWKGNKNFR